MLEKIQKRKPPCFDGLRSEQFVADHVFHHRRGGEVEGRCAKHGECGVLGIYLSKFSGRDAVFDQAAKLLEERTKIFLRNPFDFRRGIHRFALHQARIIRMALEKSEVTIHPGAKPLARRGIGSGRRVNDFSELAEKVFEDGAMKASFVSEIIIEHRFVRVGVGGDFVGASSGHALRGEMPLGGGEDSPGGCRIFNFSAPEFH